MSLVPQNISTLAYNGHLFNSSASSKVLCRVTRDRADRTTIYNDFEISVREVILPNYADSTTDNAMDLLYQQLTTTGQRLQFTANGFGTFDINAPGSDVKDVCYGPKPEVIEAVPLGGSKAWVITWKCRTRIPRCDNAKYVNIPIASNYDFEVVKDEHGYSTRIFSGYVEIPATRVGRLLPDSADAYWQALFAQVLPIPGFQRTWRRKLSEDKRTLTYQIVDVEKPPDGFISGMTAWQGEQEMRIENFGYIAVQTISATYTVDRGRPKSEALQRFMNLVASRIQGGQPFLRLTSVFPLRLVVRDQLHGQEVFCQLAYTITAELEVPGLVNMVLAGGFFAPIPDTDWNTWQDSVARTQGALGNAGIVYDKASDAIIDLCYTQPVGERSPGGVPQKVTLRGSLGFPPTPPPPNQSYLMYSISTRYLGKANLDFYKPMGVVLSAGDYQQPEMRTQDPYAVPPVGGRIQNNIGNPSDPPDIVMAQVTGDYYLLVSGYALRAGHLIPMPNLLSVAGVPAFLVDVDFQTGVMANPGIDLHWATFNLLYRLPSRPVTLPTPLNPVLRTDGAGNSG